MGIYFLSRHGRSGGRGTLPPPPVWATSWAGAPDASASILTRDGIEIRRNLQPRCRTTATSRILGLATTTSSAGWGGIAPVVSIIDDPTAPSGSGKVARITHTDAGTTAAWQDLAIAAGDGIIPATPATPYQAGIWVRSSAALTVMLSLQGLTAENASAGSIGGNSSTLAPNTWTLLTAAGTSSATVAKYRVDVDAGAAVAYPAGTTLDVDACIIGEQPYFDGDRLPATLPE